MKSDVFTTRFGRLVYDSGLIQRQVARELGISQVTLTKYLNGSGRPQFNILCKICDYFNVSADYLIGRTDKKV